MKPKNRRDYHLKRRFDAANEWYGFVLERRIRQERKMLKKTMSKHNRKLDKQAIEESMDLLDIDDEGEA